MSVLRVLYGVLCEGSVCTGERCLYSRVCAGVMGVSTGVGGLRGDLRMLGEIFTVREMGLGEVKALWHICVVYSESRLRFYLTMPS